MNSPPGVITPSGYAMRVLPKSWQCNKCGTVIVKGQKVAIVKGQQVCLDCEKAGR
jgi:hypothetical protein